MWYAWPYHPQTAYSSATSDDVKYLEADSAIVLGREHLQLWMIDELLKLHALCHAASVPQALDE